MQGVNLNSSFDMAREGRRSAPVIVPRFLRYSKREAACWAHVRRKFYDLQVAHKSPIAQEALERIAALYAIEKEIRGRPPDERREIRQTRARPFLESLHEWLGSCLTKLSQKSDTTAAVKYALGRWEALTRYAEDGALEIDNNAACAARGITKVVLNRYAVGATRLSPWELQKRGNFGPTWRAFLRELPCEIMEELLAADSISQRSFP